VDSFKIPSSLCQGQALSSPVKSWEVERGIGEGVPYAVSRVTLSTRHRLHTVLFAAALLCLPQPSLAGWGSSGKRSFVPKTAQPAVSMEAELENGYAVYKFATADGAELKITPYGSDMVRVQWHWTGVYEKDEPSVSLPPPPYRDMPRVMGESPEEYRILTPGLIVKVSKKYPLRVDFYDRRTGEPVCLDSSIQYSPEYDARQDASYNNVRSSGKFPAGFKLRNKKKAPQGVGYFGLGDWAGPLNRRGHRVQFWPDDAWQWTPKHSPKYTSFPIFYAVHPRPAGSSHVYAIFFNNPSRTVFDMARSDPGIASFSAADGQIDYFFIMGRSGSFSDIMERLTALSGRSALLPKWAYGYHSSKFTYTQSEITRLMEEFSEHSLPMSAVFLDVDYMNHGNQKAGSMKYWKVIQLTWAKQFPSPRRMISQLLRRGVRTVAMVEPFLDHRDPKFAEADRRGFFVKHIHGSTQMTRIWLGEKLAWLDFTNPEASSWWEGKVAKFCSDYGIRGIWNDLNETADLGQLRLDAVYHMGGRYPDLRDSRRWHLNVKATHSVYSTRASYRALQAAHPGERPYVLSRGGFPGIQKWAAGWSGDNLTNVKHLSCNIRAGTSVGICGFSNYGHDVGGFSGTPSPELMERWFEWASLSPSMRNHGSKSFARREPTVYEEPTRSRLSSSIRNRYYFLPHLYSLAYSSHATGRPINEPVVSVFPDDTGTFDQSENDFMVGSDVLVTPVVALGNSSRKVYFPSSGFVWHCFWDDTQYPAGRRREVPAPRGRLPVFVRPLGIVPVSPLSLRPADPESPSVQDLHPQELELHVWPGVGKNEYLFYDDGGVIPLDKPDPLRIVLRIAVMSDGKSTKVTASTVSGNPPPSTTPRLTVVFRAMDGPKASALVDGKRALVSPTRLPGAKKFRLSVPVELVGGRFVVNLRTADSISADPLPGQP
jgi:alpha-glucosidase